MRSHDNWPTIFTKIALEILVIVNKPVRRRPGTKVKLMSEMANWWENQFELIRTDWLAFLMQGEPVAIVLLLVVILFGYLTWIGIRVVWEHFRDR